MYNRKVKLDKVFTTVKDKHGNKIETGLTKGGEYKTEEGYLIMGGKMVAFQCWNMKRYLQSKQIGFENRKEKVFQRFITFDSMGIEATYNRLHAPLQGQPHNK